MPRAPAAAAARESGGLPTCQPPVPAESSSTVACRPASRTSARITPSAVGDLQMLPRHTNSTLTGTGSCIAAQRFRLCPDGCGRALPGRCISSTLVELEHREKRLLRHLDAADLPHPLLSLLLLSMQLFLAPY